MRRITIFIILAFIALFIIFYNNGICEENIKTTIYVGGSGTGNYSSLQEAINYAKSNDTVFVFSGTYYESIVIDKSIKLVGQDKNNTIIDGVGEKYV